MRRITIYKIN